MKLFILVREGQVLGAYSSMDAVRDIVENMFPDVPGFGVWSVELNARHDGEYIEL